jgi:hypothetical protein
MCLVATAVWAQGTVTGRVTAQGSNAPLSDARVLALGTNAAANTAQDGRYTLRGVRAGTIELQVLRVGYQPLKKTVTVTTGATANADFELVAIREPRRTPHGLSVDESAVLAAEVLEHRRAVLDQDPRMAARDGVIVLATGSGQRGDHARPQAVERSGRQ